MFPTAAHPWAITREALDGMLAEVERRGGDVGALATKPGERVEGAALTTMRDDVAVVRVRGPLMRYESFWSLIFGGTSYERLGREIAAAVADGNVRAVLLDVDSPGGAANGAGELGNLIYGMRGKKPIVAYAGGACCSAAYEIASAADRIYIDEAAIVGSIGCIWTLYDISEAEKGAGVRRVVVQSSQSPNKHLDPAKARDVERAQALVDALASVFVEHVARNRGVSTRKVLNDFGKGGVFVGRAAATVGLVDGVGGFEQVLANIASGTPIKSSSPSASVHTHEERTMADVKCSGCGDEIDTEKDDVYCDECYDGGAESRTKHSELHALASEIAALTGKTGGAESIGMIRAWKAAHEQAQQAQAELVALKAERRAAEFDALVEQGVKDRKLTPHQKSEATANHGSWLGRLRAREDGAAELRAFLDTAPAVVAAAAQREVHPADLSASAELSAIEKDVCVQMGISEEKYRQQKAARLKAGLAR